MHFRSGYRSTRTSKIWATSWVDFEKMRTSSSFERSTSESILRRRSLSSGILDASSSRELLVGSLRSSFELRAFPEAWREQLLLLAVRWSRGRISVAGSPNASSQALLRRTKCRNSRCTSVRSKLQSKWWIESLAEESSSSSRRDRQVLDPRRTTAKPSLLLSSLLKKSVTQKLDSFYFAAFERT